MLTHYRGGLLAWNLIKIFLLRNFFIFCVYNFLVKLFIAYLKKTGKGALKEKENEKHIVYNISYFIKISELCQIIDG